MCCHSYLCSFSIVVSGSLKTLTAPELNPQANTFPTGPVHTQVASSSGVRKSNVYIRGVKVGGRGRNGGKFFFAEHAIIFAEYAIFFV